MPEPEQMSATDTRLRRVILHAMFPRGLSGNCTWWAAYKRPDMAEVITGSGWKWWDNGTSMLKALGFDRRDRSRRVGAIAEFDSPGHVAYVTECR
jgi:hypothetical protein